MTDVIDLRSDTVTRPTEGMRLAMSRADVGDDVYGEDPTVIALEERVADLLGHEAALFTATGSMANLLGVGLLARPGAEVLCDDQAHVVRAELGAHAAVNGITTRTWHSDRGRLRADRVMRLVAHEAGPFVLRTSAVAVEDSHNFGGGTTQDIGELRALRARTAQLGVGVHLDGARLWNAHVATGVPLADYGSVADTVTVCLSKGLGAPVGSLIVSDSDNIAEARRRRKMLGGGMRQVGMLAAAGLYALDHHLDLLPDDHDNARTIAEAMGLDPFETDTNIVVAEVANAPQVAARAKDNGVLVSALSPTTLRAVTHLDVDTAAVARAASVLRSLVEE